MRPRLTLHRGHAAFVHDVLMAGMSFLAALYLRLGEDLMPGWPLSQELLAAAAFAAVAGVVLSAGGLYKGVWRYASVNDLVMLVRSVTITVTCYYLGLFVLTRLTELPRTVPVIHWFVMLTLLGGPRFLYRRFKDHRRANRLMRDGDQRIPVLLVGAGDEADLFLRAMQAPDAQYVAVGMVADKETRVGRNIQGVDVLGTLDDLAGAIAMAAKRGRAPQRLVITDHGLDGTMVRQLLDEAEKLGLGLSRVPKLSQLKDGLSDTLEMRPIAVEDLLGRPQQVLDRDAMSGLLQGQRVVVTGAGGSIGSELVRQVADFNPAQLILVDACEFNLYSIDMEVSERWPDLSRVALLGDVRDRVRIDAIMEEFRPQLVFHAAALKHVPMVEFNTEEGLLTNGVGTRIVADAAAKAGVRLMVQISTDKAVNPTNVMGASKRVAEMYAQALDLASATQFVTVRFGNVLGSAGSVVPLFTRQLAAGGPLTVTHPDMTRYFMTIREAVELVLQASVWGTEHASERGKIMVLDMGEPVKIVHLAQQMIRLAGLRPDQDVKIVFTGLRPGEKLFEELFHGNESLVPTDRKGLMLAAPRLVDLETMADAMDRLEAACRNHDARRALAIMEDLVPEYQGDGDRAEDTVQPLFQAG